MLQCGSSGGDLTLQVAEDDKDMIFQCDDGSGGVTEYFKLEGANTRLTFSKNASFSDNVKVQLGSSVDFEMYHDGTDTQYRNFVGDLLIKQETNDGDIIFQCDNGSGGLVNYLIIDGGSENVQFNRSVFLYDNVFLNIGGSFDLRLYHDGNSNIKAQGSGDLIIAQTGSWLGNTSIKLYIFRATINN